MIKNLKLLLNTIFILLLNKYFVFGSHFYGGSLSSRPVADNGAQVVMEFTERFAYRRNYSAATLCTQTTIDTLTLFAPSANIVCITGCIRSNQVIGTTTQYCSAFSEQDNWSYGSKSFVKFKRVF